MTQTHLATQCYNCRHFDLDNLRGVTCNAYPHGIPEAIVLGEHDHTQPFAGDNGIHFESWQPSKDEPEAVTNG